MIVVHEHQMLMPSTSKGGWH